MKIIIIALISISLGVVTKFNVTNNDTTKVKNFYKNGQLKTKGLKINKFKCGDWYYYNESGKIIKVERDRAFFGEYPTAIAPLKLVTPPGLRHPIAITKAMYSGDWERFAHYHAYTMFPFGRIVKDISPFAKNNLIENPMSLVDKFTGFPLQKLSSESKKMRKGVGAWYPWNPHGSEREVDL